MENKINVIKAKDEYAKYCGALDWYDHINGMSARDVEIEMEYVCEYLTNPILEMLRKCEEAMSELMEHQDGWEQDYEYLQQLIKEATEL